MLHEQEDEVLTSALTAHLGIRWEPDTNRPLWFRLEGSRRAGLLTMVERRGEPFWSLTDVGRKRFGERSRGGRGRRSARVAAASRLETRPDEGGRAGRRIQVLDVDENPGARAVGDLGLGPGHPDRSRIVDARWTMSGHHVRRDGYRLRLPDPDPPGLNHSVRTGMLLDDPWRGRNPIGEPYSAACRIKRESETDR